MVGLEFSNYKNYWLKRQGPWKRKEEIFFFFLHQLGATGCLELAGEGMKRDYYTFPVCIPKRWLGTLFCLHTGKGADQDQEQVPGATKEKLKTNRWSSWDVSTKSCKLMTHSNPSLYTTSIYSRLARLPAIHVSLLCWQLWNLRMPSFNEISGSSHTCFSLLFKDMRNKDSGIINEEFVGDFILEPVHTWSSS